MDQIGFIYTLTCLVNDKVYIGSTRNYKRRIGQHTSRLLLGSHHSKHLQNAWNKYGQDAFRFELVETVDAIFLFAREQFWIWRTNASNAEFGYNTVGSVGSNNGAPHTDESRLAMSRARKGARTPRRVSQWKKVLEGNRGKKRSPETVEKIRQSNLGSTRSDATRKLISERGMGRKHTDDAKGKIRLAGIGRKHSDETKEKCAVRQRGVPKPRGQVERQVAATKGKYLGAARYNAREVVQLSMEGEIIAVFDSGATAARETNCHNAAITKVISGKLNKTGGSVWRRIEQLTLKQCEALVRFRDDKPVSDGIGV